MEITTLKTEAPAGGLVEFSGSLSAEEASELARGAYLRIATALHVDETEARKRAWAMLTDMELGVLAEETVKARAADRAIQRLGIAFLLAPSIRLTSPYEEGEPFSFTASAHSVPAMDLNLGTPIRIEGSSRPAPTLEPDSETAVQAEGVLANGTRPAREDAAATSARANLEGSILRALRTRLTGTVPASLESAAIAFENSSFQKKLEEHGETFREYRIRTGKKIQDVEEDLRRSAMEKLYEEIALETIYRAQGLSVTPEDERMALSSMAPGREDDLRAELDNAGRLWMLSQKARRDAALRWAVEHLLR